MGIISRAASQAKRTLQYIFNASYDEDYDVVAFENLGLNLAENTMDRVVNINAADVRFDADDSAPNYIGINATNGAGTDAETWLVFKFTYSGSNVTRIHQ